MLSVCTYTDILELDITECVNLQCWEIMNYSEKYWKDTGTMNTSIIIRTLGINCLC